LVELLERFQICIPKPEYILHQDKNQNISKLTDLQMVVPCLLTQEIPQDISQLFSPSNGKEILGRKYRFPFIPRGVFEALFIKIASFLGSNMRFWKNGLLISAEEDKGELLFEMKEEEREGRSAFHIQAIGELNHSLIDSFHFAIKELLETEYPLTWNTLEIEIEYQLGAQPKLFTTLKQCKSKWEQNQEMKTPSGPPIPWIKLIPEYCSKETSANRVDATKFIPGRKLGEGTYAIAYVCRALNKPGEFAVKRFKVNKGMDKVQYKKIRASFEREFEIMKQLDHPNVTRLIGSDERGYYWYLAIHLYDDSLKGVQKKLCSAVSKGISFYPLEMKEDEREKYWWRKEEILFFAKELLNGLHYLHSKNIVHLDLKVFSKKQIFFKFQILKKIIFF
jgi:hypothetical protein